MGTTSRHLPCFVPEDTAKWRTFLLAERTVMRPATGRLSCWGPQWCAAILGPSAVLKKRSSMRACGFLKPPGSENERQVRTAEQIKVAITMFGSTSSS